MGWLRKSAPSGLLAEFVAGDWDWAERGKWLRQILVRVILSRSFESWISIWIRVGAIILQPSQTHRFFQDQLKNHSKLKMQKENSSEVEIKKKNQLGGNSFTLLADVYYRNAKNSCIIAFVPGVSGIFHMFFLYVFL